MTYNAMILGYVAQALLLFRELQEKEIEPTEVTILGVISSCALLGALEFGKRIHEYVKKNGFDQSAVKVNTSLIDMYMYTKCGSLEDAVSVFRSMDYRDTQAWSTMILLKSKNE
nr:pentatricopeptide repeat-containing protein At2g02980, chloroplastic isoform X1 [Ipomoea trifida]